MRPLQPLTLLWGLEAAERIQWKNFVPFPFFFFFEVKPSEAICVSMFTHEGENKNRAAVRKRDTVNRRRLLQGKIYRGSSFWCFNGRKQMDGICSRMLGFIGEVWKNLVVCRGFKISLISHTRGVKVFEFWRVRNTSSNFPLLLARRLSPPRFWFWGRFWILTFHPSLSSRRRNCRWT